MPDSHTIWIDALEFGDHGGWAPDTQFTHLAGSACLLAAGVGTPVAEARHTVSISAAGEYRLWVRCRNWLPEHAPGRFSVALSGQSAAVVFGMEQSSDWVWVDGGVFGLAAGDVELALQDRTGWFGRCAALILASDPEWRPPERAADQWVGKCRVRGADPEAKAGGEYDLVVCGGGLAGFTMALQSARLGVRTALLSDRPVLGGNASAECGVSLDGAGSRYPHAREGGIVEELFRARTFRGDPHYSGACQVLADREPNLAIHLHRRVVGVEKADGRTIHGVTAVDPRSGQPFRYRGILFADATGDGWVAHYAGAACMLGREERDRFGEDLAPVQADRITMSGCLMGVGPAFRAEPTDRDVSFAPPAWAPALTDLEGHGREIGRPDTGAWWIEHAGDIDQLNGAEEARDELIRISLGYWDYVKNRWPGRAAASTYALRSIPFINARREGRRVIGDYVLTQTDVQEAPTFPDAVAYGGWTIDLHHPRGIYSGSEGPFDSNAEAALYTIPYRCLYARDLDNLFLAGRCISVSHIALGTVRVQATLSACGQAVGVAAALCLQRELHPRDVHPRTTGELQQLLLQRDAHIPGVPREDPGDLVRGARVRASSVEKHDVLDRASIHLNFRYPLDRPHTVVFRRGGLDRVQEIHLYCSSGRNEAAPLELAIGEANVADEAGTAPLQIVRANVPSGSEGWVVFPVDCAVQAEHLWFTLAPCPGVAVHGMDEAPPGARLLVGEAGKGWTDHARFLPAFHTVPDLCWPADFSPANVVNGVTRRMGDAPNVWASEAGDVLPQWIELDFGRPVRFNTVHLTFDTNMNTPRYGYMPAARVPRECVTAYCLEVQGPVAAGWETLAEVQGNYQRLRVHRFAPVTASKLCLTAHATGGHPSARLFGMRVYCEPHAERATDEASS